MVESGRTDVVRPSVAADDPHAAIDKLVRNAEQHLRLRSRVVVRVEARAQFGNSGTLGGNRFLRALVCVEQCSYESLSQLGSEPLDECSSEGPLAVGGKADAEHE